MSEAHAALQRVLDRTVDGRRVFGAAACVATRDGQRRFAGGAGNLDATRAFFIASTTKLFVTALIMRLCQDGKLTLDSHAADFLPSELTERLLVYRDADYSRSLTIRHLLAHTSGLPDYFGDRRPDGRRLVDELLAGQDSAWSVEDVVRDIRQIKPPFRPGAKGKAHYSDTNFQLLGRIIETVLGVSFGQAVLTGICRPLGLERTYLYDDPTDTRPADLYFKAQRLRIPKAMASVGPDGGIVSTAEELLVFVRALFEGQLFDARLLDDVRDWRRIMFPLESGVGLMRFKVPWIFAPFGPRPELLGHSGLSGAFAFFAPARGVYLAGTVNQIHRPDLSFRLMLRLLGSI